MNSSNGWFPMQNQTQTPNHIPNQQTQGQSPIPSYMQSSDPSRVARDYALELILRLNPAFMIPPEEDFSSEELQGTFQQLLNGNLGSYMIGEFLVGTSGLTTKEGFLVGVGRSFILLYDFNSRSFILCDAFALKFATFPYLDATTIQRYIPRRYLIDLDQANGSTLSQTPQG